MGKGIISGASNFMGKGVQGEFGEYLGARKEGTRGRVKWEII